MVVMSLWQAAVGRYGRVVSAGALVFGVRTEVALRGPNAIADQVQVAKDAVRSRPTYTR